MMSNVLLILYHTRRNETCCTILLKNDVAASRVHLHVLLVMHPSPIELIKLSVRHRPPRGITIPLGPQLRPTNK